MKLIYMASICPKDKFKALEKEHPIISVAAFRFNSLLAEGLASHSYISLFCPVANIIYEKLVKHKVVSEKTSKEGVFDYLPLAKGNFKYVKSIFNILKYVKKHKEGSDSIAIICDSLSISFSISCFFSKLFYKIPTIAIVTDLPQYVGEENNSFKKIFFDKISLWLMNRFSAYILLTEPMNKYVNPNGKPYCIIEGLSDIDMKKENNFMSEKHTNKICLYAGSIHKEYGISNLINAFVDLPKKDVELHIYGQGNYSEKIIEISKKHPNVFYKGVVSNDEVKEEEKKATLLINPRPTDKEYTKYSFPSKTMEYMASGTPLATTKLPGMPSSYYPYLYLIEDETEEGIKKTLEKILELPCKELHEKGRIAKQFILKNKNNVSQANRVIEMIYKLVKGG